MRTTKCGEIYISIDTHTTAERVYKGEERKQGSGETEREGVCVRVLVDTNGSVGQHPQTTWEQETHLAFY